MNEYLNESYEVFQYRYHDVVITSHEPVFQHVNDLPENFNTMVSVISVDEEGITWDLKLDNLEGLIGSITSGSKTIRQGQKYSHRHEFVAEAFQLGKTDSPMKNILTLEDDDDGRTPDFIIINDDIIHVIELTTTRSNLDSKMIEAYEHKMYSYYPALENRCLGKLITYTVIVVSTDKVLSSISLSDDLVRELIARMRIAVSLSLKAEMIGVDLQDDERSQFTNRVKESIREEVSKIEYKRTSDSPHVIDPDYILTMLVNPNEEEVVKTFLDELDKSRTEIIEDINSDKLRDIEEFKKKFEIGNRRSDLKCVIIFPCLNCEEKLPSSDIPKKSIPLSDECPTLSKLWGTCMDLTEISPSFFEEDPNTLLSEALSEDAGKVELMESTRKEKRRSYHRVDIRGYLSDSELCDLALHGLWAKKHKEDDFMKERRKHQQAGFKWNTYTDDILEYLNNTDDLNTAKTQDVNKNVDLIKHAEKLSENSSKMSQVLESWSKTQIFQTMEIISDIAFEVSISNKQHCKDQEMIIKKLRKYEIYLLISPTKSSEHAFVSLYIPEPCKINKSTVFGKTYKVHGGFITDFFSIKAGKLENQSSMSSSIITLASFWSWFYELESADPDSFKLNSEAYFMLKLSLLMRLEDKAQTEETITLTRYMYMEIFKSEFSIRPPDPFKILQKLTTFPRSRLNLFFIKRILMAFEIMLTRRPSRVLHTDSVRLEEGEDSIANDAWEGMLNWASLYPVKTASKTVNLMYIGYLKNKMEPPEGNTDFQLVDKTIQEEFDMDKDDLEAYRGNPSRKPKGKQFKMNNIIHGCSIMEKRLKDMFGSNWKDVVENDICENLSKRMSLELATLKASANIEHKDDYPVAELSSNLSANRIKALEAVFKKIEEIGVNPYTKIKSIIEKIENTSKGVICDLFKKQQHGGLREIYVLTIESRIVQLYLETISRTLCSYFEEETLTHPKNKLRKLDEHRTNTARISTRDNCVYADFCSSTDKTRWNQNFVMTAMVIPLIRLTPKKFHNSIIRIINMWTLKMIKLPQRVVNMMLRSVEMDSKTYARLNKEFWGREESSVFKKKFDTFIRLTSGMMQGILHYTSSLLHLTFLNSMNKIIPFLLKKIYPDHSFYISQVCSSDDSATILSVFSPKGERDLTLTTYKACKKASLFLEVLNDMAPYYCMKNSVKSTTGIVDYVEFNSEFIFRNTIAIPIIKYVAAMLNITESESFLERFQTMYNLTSDLMASGFPAYNTSLCQYAQAYNHYKTMGSSVNPLFEVWVDAIICLPDPTLGYFIIDCDLCPGVLGYSYALWIVARKTNILKRSLKSAVTDIAEVTDSGGIMLSIVIKHGENKRWRQLSRNISENVDIKEEIEKDPELLFRMPNSTKELRTALAIKSTMPSVGKSLRRGNPYMQSLAMSVYSINTHCFSKTSLTQDLTGKVIRETKKTSLLLELKNRLAELEESPPLSQDILNATFPANDRYLEAEKIIKELRKYSLVKCTPFRNRRVEIFVQPFSSVVPLSLLQTLSHYWFAYHVKTSNKIFLRCLENYKVTLPWIRDNIKDTLLQSPFKTYQELVNFINSHTIRSRTFVRVGPGVSSKRLTGQLYQLIKKSQKEGYVLKNLETRVKEYKGQAEIVSKISLSLLLPTNIDRKKQIERILSTSYRIYDDMSSIQKMSKRDSCLSYIQSFVKRDYSLEEITTSIQQTGHGLLFSYTRPQERVEISGKVYWRGRGQCIVHCEQILIVVNMNDDIATSIEVSSWKKIRGHPSTLSMILKELSLKPLREKGHIGKSGILARFDGSHWTTPRLMGTPIFENRSLEPMIREVSDVKLKIGYQSVELAQSTARGELSMLRFKTYPGDILLNPSSISSGDWIDAWQNQRSYEDEKASALILATNNEKMPTSLKEWITRTLLARLSQKGLTKSFLTDVLFIPSLEVDTTTTRVEIGEEELTRLGMEFFESEEQLLGLPTEVLAQDLEVMRDDLLSHNLQAVFDLESEGDKLVSDWANVIHNWKEVEIEENVDITSRGVKSFIYLHCFWDNMIDSISENYSSFWKDTFNGKINTSYPELSKTIIKLAKIKLEKPKLGLRERAELRIQEVSQLFSQSPIREHKDDEPSWVEMVEEEESELDVTERPGPSGLGRSAIEQPIQECESDSDDDLYGY